MALNCKPGDLAVIIREAKGRDDICGRIVEVIKKAPSKGDFLLPCGYRHHEVNRGDEWIVRFPNLVKVDLSCGGSRLAEFACVSDCSLRPLRDSDGQDERFAWAGKPAKEPA